MISLIVLVVLLIAITRIKATFLIWTAVIGALLLLATVSGAWPSWLLLLAWLIFVPLLLLNITPLRREWFSRPMLAYTKSVLPPISQTEQEAIDAGTVWWEAELFRGEPNWSKLHTIPKPQFSTEEQAYLDGPVEELCKMLDDWQITHELNDLPPEVWSYLLDHKFFAINIPQEFGGLGFSALANSAIVSKVASRSGSAGVTVMVPNSLGPAELLLHYGTDKQKQYYLPRLASGQEIPCFALTSPVAGSDAGAIPDAGIVCKGKYKGKEVLGFRTNWSKRYITLGPVATLLGLAFKAYDPDGLLGDKEELGITCALVPTNHKDVSIGRRHYPLNAAFQNGPNWGEDVFIPMSWVIGAEEGVGRGWRMLMGCLSAGRGISLPATGVCASKMAVRMTGAYARIREQFGISINKFEGIDEALARMGGLTYMMESARLLTLAGLDIGEKPAIVSAIAKYYLTEGARQVVDDAMDVHGGRAICMGPNNYMARSYQQIPIAITVEGANILTRTLIIFGQGAFRCHPFLLKEVTAASIEDDNEALEMFDKALYGHIGYASRNAMRSFTLGLSRSYLAPNPEQGSLNKYYRYIARYSAAFSFLSDITLMLLGGALKRKEKLSGRFADAMTHMFLCTASLKKFVDDGKPKEDLPLVEWACQYNIYHVQMALDGILRNFPNPVIGVLLRGIIFPLGRRHRMPSDRLGQQAAKLITEIGASRDRLTDGMYLSDDPQDPIGRMEDAFAKVSVVDDLRRRIRKAGLRPAERVSYPDWLLQLRDDEHINGDEYDQLLAAHEASMQVIQVDDFAPGEQQIKYKK
ncbi:MAG: acyl-CoA dehydrogenase [Arenicella sp.]